MRSNHGGLRGVGRLAGCLWLVLAGLAFLLLGGAFGVGIDASFAVVPLLVIPVGIALVVFVWGNRVAVMLLSAVAGFSYAGLGVWNYLRAEAFERANPGAAEISAGAPSLTFVLLTVATGAWSLGAIELNRRRRRQ